MRNVPDVAAEANTDIISATKDPVLDTMAAPASLRRDRPAFWRSSISKWWPTGTQLWGFVNPIVYSIGAGTNYNNDFHDITSGNNNNGHGQSCNAVVGYDLVTG
jgi:hypothetical protein